MAVAAPAQPSIADIIAAGARYGPNAGLAIQRSQYLANALQALEANATTNTRTPLALGANLLADGITQWDKGRADKQAMTAYSAERAKQDAGILEGLQPPDAGQPAVPPPQAAPSPDPAGPAIAPPAVAATPPVQIGGAPQGPATPVAANSNALSPADQLKVAQMVWGEARGEPPEGQQAVAAVALNRLKKQPGAAIADILDAPNQFEGYTPKAKSQTPDKLATILANIQPALSGADPTGGATNFYAPALQAQLGRQPPPFAVGPGQTIGHQQFFGGSPQAAQQLASAAAPQHAMPPGVMAGGGNPQGNPEPPALPGGGSLAMQPAPGGPGVAQPYQVASNGPTPPPPMASLNAPPPPAPLPQAGAAPPPAMSSPQAGGAGPQPMGSPGAQAPPMPQMAQAAPMQPHVAQGVPTGPPPTPAEMTHLRTLLGSPMTHDQGVAYGESLQRRMVTPIEPPKNMMWGANGQAVPIPGTEYHQIAGQSPSDAAQIDPFHQVTHSAVPGVQGGVPEGTRYDQAQGRYVPIAGGQSTVSPGPIPGTFRVVSPSGDLKIVSDPNMTSAPPSGYDRNPANPSQLIPQGMGGPQGAPGAPAAPGKAPIPPALQETYLKTIEAYHKAPGYTDYTNSVNAANALEANLKAALGNNTVVNQTAVDATIRAMTGLSARQGSVNSVIEHLPWSEQLKGFVQHAIGPDGANGYITPKVLQQFRTAVHAYADGHRPLAEQEYAAYNSGANRMGFDLGQDLPTVSPQAPVKWLDDASAGPAPQAGGAPSSVAQGAAAEIARRKAAGVWKGP